MNDKIQTIGSIARCVPKLRNIINGGEHIDRYNRYGRQRSFPVLSHHQMAFYYGPGMNDKIQTIGSIARCVPNNSLG